MTSDGASPDDGRGYGTATVAVICTLDGIGDGWGDGPLVLDAGDDQCPGLHLYGGPIRTFRPIEEVET